MWLADPIRLNNLCMLEFSVANPNSGISSQTSYALIDFYGGVNDFLVLRELLPHALGSQGHVVSDKA